MRARPGERLLNSEVLDRIEELSAAVPGTDLLAELVSLFEASYPPKVASMRAALGRGSLDDARVAAHALKSSASALSAEPLAALCQRLEYAIDLRPEDASALVEEIAAVAVATALALREELSRRRAG